jgi:hypothetical protein
MPYDSFTALAGGAKMAGAGFVTVISFCIQNDTVQRPEFSPNLAA